MKCIICLTENDSKSVEHIIPESFGNKFYILEKNTVCDSCNNSFSEFEGKALTKSIFVMERARLGVLTKRDKNAKGKVTDIVIEGDENFREQYVNLSGLSEENTKDFKPGSNEFSVIIPTFDKSEVAVSKLLLSMGIESIYFSQRKVYKKYNFDNLRDFLLKKSNKDWPFITTPIEINTFKSVARFNDKLRLKKQRIEIKFKEEGNNLLFKFHFGAISMTINLINRDFDWIKDFHKLDPSVQISPDHFMKKVTK